MDRRSFLSAQNVQDAAFFNLVQALQAAVDLGAHVIADSGWETPASLGQVFAILAREGAIPTDLSVRLASLAGLRNLIVHRYGMIDLERVHSDLPADMDALARFGDLMLAGS